MAPHPDLQSKTLSDNLADSACPLDNGRHQGSMKYGLGDLDKLPLELQSDILIELDLQTLTGFRRVNRRAMEVVDTLPDYQTILQHSPASVRAVLTVELGRFLTCRMLLNTLRTVSCAECGKPTEYIYLLTCHRVCHHCLLHKTKYSPITVEEAALRFKVPRRLLEGSPTMRSIPGRYASDGLFYLPRLTLVDSLSAFLVGDVNRDFVHYFHVNSWLASPVGDVDRDTSQAAIRALPMPPLDFLLAMAPWSPAGEATRFMAVIRAPFLRMPAFEEAVNGGLN